MGEGTGSFCRRMAGTSGTDAECLRRLPGAAEGLQRSTCTATTKGHEAELHVHDQSSKRGLLFSGGLSALIAGDFLEGAEHNCTVAACHDRYKRTVKPLDLP